MKKLTQYGCLNLLAAYIMLELGCSEETAADIAYEIYPSVDTIIHSEQ